jgi:hypothetical protein
MNVRQLLSTIGAVIAIYGVASGILFFIGYTVRFLVWVDRWGTPAGWGIRALMVVVGAALYISGRKAA